MSLLHEKSILYAMRYNCTKEKEAGLLAHEPDNVIAEATKYDALVTQVKFLKSLPRIPLVFIGLGFYRAWIEIASISTYTDFPLNLLSAGEVFQITAVVVWLLAALFAKRFAPISKRRTLYFLSGGVLMLATIANYYTMLNPQIGNYVALPVAVASGAAIALVILIWSEFFSCLNPLRTALYYSCSIVVAALLIFLSKGLVAEYLIVFKVMLPALSLLFAFLSFKKLPKEEQPRPMTTRFAFPWKPVLLMAIFSFAYGLKQNAVLMEEGPHSSAGVIAAAAIVFIAVISQGEKFNFGLLHRFGFPVMVASFLLVPDFGIPVESISWFCAAFSYTAFSILIMILLSNMAYRYGMNALWLFGIERAVRQLFTLGGVKVNSLVANMQPVFENGAILVNVATVLLVVITTMIVFSEKELASSWGVGILADKSKRQSDQVSSEESSQGYLLGVQCAALSRRYILSTREAEVLLLLAQKKSIGRIEQELLIANGTAKAHVRHIYQKLNIHSREELFKMLANTDIQK